MKKHLFSLAILCLLTFQAFSQNPLNFSMKAGLISGKPNIAFGKGTMQSHQAGRDGGRNFSLAFSLPIVSKLRIGTEMGLTTFEPQIKRDFIYAPDYIISYDGGYSIQRTYFAVAPEYRILKSLFVNAGLAFYIGNRHEFTNGTRLVPSGMGRKLEGASGYSFSHGDNSGYFFGLGYCPNLTNELAFLVEARYTSSPATGVEEGQISMGYNALLFNVGLMYKPKK